MRNVSVLLCLIVALPVHAATWYVRPRGSGGATHDGRSYETAWNGVNAIAWGAGGVSAGDTLYMCGIFDRDTEANPNALLWVQASGSAGNPITIRGDYPGDPGWLIAAKKISSWTDNGDGTYQAPWTAIGTEAWEGTPGGTEYALKPVTSAAEVLATDGSHWCDTVNHVMWYNPTGTPASPRTVYTNWFWAVYGNGNSYITLYKLTCYCGGSSWGVIQTDRAALNVADVNAPGGDGTIHSKTGGFTSAMVGRTLEIIEGTHFTSGYYTISTWTDTHTIVLDRSPVTEAALDHNDGFLIIGECPTKSHDWVIDNCIVKYAATDGIRNGLPGDHLTITNNTITEFTSGIYIKYYGGSPQYVTISNNYLDCGTGGYNSYWATFRGESDRGAIALQPGDDYEITDNYIARAVDYGIFFFRFTSHNNTVRNFHVERNWIQEIHDPGNAYYSFGIGVSIGNEAGTGDDITGMLIAYNVIKNCYRPGAPDSNHGIGLRMCSGKTTDPDDRVRIIGNLVMGCDTNIRLNHASSPADESRCEYICYNNISYAPGTGGYHCRVDPPATSYNLDMGYNCWYPDTSGGNNQFKWANSAVADNFADFVADAATAGVSVGSHSLTSDPQFANASTSDFSLRTGSPCIDAGTNLGETYQNAVGPGSTWPNSVLTCSQSLQGSSWEIGPYVYTGVVSYTLATAASGGIVVKSPDKSSYGLGEMVSLQAMPDVGHTFASWSGSVTGSSNPATLVMDGNKSVTANFLANAYTLTVAGVNGSVSKSPQKATYEYGETVSLQAVPSTGCHFTGWSGDLSGSTNPAYIVMNANKSVTANFVANTYTLNTTAPHGSVVASPQRASYTYGETVSLQAIAAAGYEFAGWSGALSGAANPASLVMDSDKSVTAVFTAVAPDLAPPVLSGCSPQPDAIQVPLNALVLLHVSDAGKGVDANTVAITVKGSTVYAGNVASDSRASGVCRRVGTKANYTYVYQATDTFDFDETVTVTVNTADLAGNVMTPQRYSFKTQMRAFGGNHWASWGLEGLDKGSPATVRDNTGNIWVVWHAGPAGQRDVYLSKLTDGATYFDSPVQIMASTGDQCNPDLAIGTDGKLYAVWQDNRRGNWDIYIRTSTDGVTWSAAVQVTDLNGDEVNPVIAVNAQSSNCAYIAWQDSRAGQQDIYVASSNDGFATKTVSRVTSDASDQICPQIAVDASNAVYLVWTDYRSGAADIYGAASDRGPWTNVAVVTGTGNQSAPVIAAEATGSILHLAWVSDASGNDDVCYASSNGLPASPLPGMNIADDTSGTNQRAPALALGGGVGEEPRVFVCWQDGRNVRDGRDTDLYFVQVRAGGETNLLVGDGGTQANQNEPVLGVDLQGYPYVLWSDDRNTNVEIYYAASTFVEPTPLDTQLVSAAVGKTVGVASPSRVDDVSVVIPAGACPYDVTVAIAKIENLQVGWRTDILPYEFGPSGLQFDVPVTITIPYAVAEFGARQPVPYWHDSLTGTVTQQGITNIQYVALSSTTHALRFQTTHFTPYVLLALVDGGVDGGGTGDTSSGGGGGGCSLSPVAGMPGVVEFLVPYLLLAAIMIALRLRDVKRYSTSGGRSSRN